MALVLLIGAHGAALAQTGRNGAVVVGGEIRTLFEARGVPVDVTAASVTEARERALTQGRVGGLRQAMEHLSPRAEWGKIPSPSANEVIDIVQEFSLANERTSAVRYLADMSVRFNPDAVRRLMRAARLSYTEIPSRPMVIVPLYIEGPRLMLGEDGNPWREAWARLRDRSPLVPLLLPPVDAPIRADQVLANDTAALQALAAQYGAAGVIVLKLAAADTLTVAITEMRGGDASDATVTYTPEAGQTREQAFLGAAAAAADAIAQHWITRNLVDMSVTTQLTALVPVTDLKDWLRIRERLRDMPLVSRVDLQAITRDRAQITVRYAGDQARLQAALADEDLALTNQGGVWILGARRAEAVEAQ